MSPSPSPPALVTTVSEAVQGAVLAIGNCDGMHLGHQALARRALAEARAAGRPAYVLSFEPHPRTHFDPAHPVFRLTPLALKHRLVRALGLDGLMALPFATIAPLSAEAFIVDLLARTLRVGGVVTGEDFRFGAGRQGTLDHLRALGARHAIAVTTVAAVAAPGPGGGVVSSSAIRTALGQGDVLRANALLGWRWRVEGEVIHGDKRGRVLGFPTANMMLPPETELRHGVYAARARAGQAWYAAAAHFGRRVQFGGGPVLLETHLLDFAGDLYGRPLVVELCDFLRPEQAFASVEALVDQMGRDVFEARRRVSASLAEARTDLQAALEA